jgi:hypothetical protein
VVVVLVPMALVPVVLAVLTVLAVTRVPVAMLVAARAATSSSMPGGSTRCELGESFEVSGRLARTDHVVGFG